MAFPSVRSQINTSGTGTTSTPVVNLPATVAAGDILFVDIRVAVAGAIGWPEGWNELYDSSADGADDQQAGAWKKADGSEDGTTITLSSGNGKFRAMAVSIRDAADPNLTPPEVSTVAIGTTPNEPDATLCTPTGGAKDYLWITLFGMAGEQTGITAYPASFTLNQSGLANSGTGAAATTNCTGALCAQQLNAASLDAGVWDVAGTLVEWSAYTVVFHPAEAIPLPLPNGGSSMPSFLVKTPPTVTALTIAVNLLQGNLAPIIDPFFQNSWPVPPSKPFILVDINSRPGNDGDEAFNQTEWPNPLSKGKVEGWTNNNLQNTLKPEELIPFIPVDLSNPIVKKSNLVGFVFSHKLEEVDIPIGRTNELNPLIGKINQVGFVTSRKIDEPTDFPFVPIDYKNPLIKERNSVSFVDSRIHNLDSLIPVNWKEWKNPEVNKAPGITWTQNLLQSTLTPIVGDPPFRQSNWPIFRGKPGLIVDISSIINAEPSEKPIGGFVDIEIDRRKVNRGWLDFYTIDETTPNAAQVWSNPVDKRRNALTFIHNRKLDEPPAVDPFINLSYPNPLLKKRMGLTYTYLAPFQEIFTSPVGGSSYNLPVLKVKPLGLTWINPRPSYFQEPSSLRIFQIEWPNPLRKKGYQAINTVHRGDPTVPVKPRGQVEWPNPALRRKINPTWIDNYTVDQNQPPVAQYLTLPSYKKREFSISWLQPPVITTPTIVFPFNSAIFDNPKLIKIRDLTWINTSNSLSAVPFFQSIWPNPFVPRKFADWTINRPSYYEETIVVIGTEWKNPLIKNVGHVGFIHNGKQEEINPLISLEYPNPKLKGKLGESWIVNLLQSTLEPAPGDTPFFKNEWPNPTISNKFGIALVHVKSFTLEEVIPLVNAEWPNPKYKTVPNKGYVDFEIISEEQPVKRNIITEVPESKQRETLTWIQNLLNDTLVVLPEIRQNEWPNPLIGKKINEGFIQDNARLIIGDRPFGFIEVRVPRKRELGLTWIDNPILLITSIPGIKPLAQYDWPIFKNVKRIHVFDFTNSLIVLPNIVGRRICLLADDTEYHLEASVEEFDLNASMTVYDLEAGPGDCED